MHQKYDLFGMKIKSYHYVPTEKTSEQSSKNDAAVMA